MDKTLRMLVLLLIVLPAAAQTESIPDWKIDYDSAQIYWKHDIPRSVILLASAEKIALNDLGLYDDNYLAILSDLGLAYSQVRDFAKAEACVSKSLRIQKELYPSDDPHVVQAKLNLAAVHLRSGNDDRAKLLYKEILVSKGDPGDTEAGLGLIHIYDYHDQLDSAGVIIRLMLSRLSAVSAGQLEVRLAEAKILRKQKKYNEARAVLTILGLDLADRTRNRENDDNELKNNVSLEHGLIDVEVGDYHDAERELLQLYRHLKTSADPDLMLLTEASTGIGFLYEKTGIYDKAMAYYRESLDRCATAYGFRSLSCMVLQNNIAGVLLHQGKNKEAIAQYESFLADYRKTTFNGMIVWTALNNLATAYRQDGRYAEALEKFKYVYSHLEHQHLTEDDLAATVLNNMAVTYALMGEAPNAAKSFEKALRIKESLYGADAPVLVDITSNLAVAYWMDRRYADALPLFKRSLTLAEREIRYLFPNLTEREQVEFYRHQKENFERFNTIATSHTEYPQLLVQMFNNQLLLKSMGFFTNQKRAEQVKLTADKNLAAAVTLLDAKGTQLTNFYQLPAATLASLHLSVPRLEHEIDSLEKIVRTDAVSARNFPQWGDIRSALKSNEALVEIVRFRKYDALPQPKTASGKTVRFGFTDSTEYAALITLRSSVGAPTLVMLRNGNQLETRLLNYYRNTRRFDVDDSISYGKFWKPIESALPASVTTVYLNRDGVYHQININAIHDRSHKFILEKYNLRLLLNAAQLLSRRDQGKANFSKMVFMGNPEFTSAQKPAERRSGLQNLQPLPGTLAEIRGILDVLKLDSTDSRVYTGARATESNLRRLSSPSILHIATHGFFSPSFVYLNEQVRNEYMFHSGLVLSEDGKSSSESLTSTDGIVTAREVMALNLQHTDLVVLSACETGLGRIEDSEGVYGLQRAFLQAGAHEMIISLWKVDDAMTRELMILFYNYLREAGDAQRALSLAQTDMMHRYSDPGVWGAFILVTGD